MPIVYPLALPVSAPYAEIIFSNRSVVGVTDTEFTLQDQAQVYQGQRWEADIIVPKSNRDDFEDWRSFVLKLNGRQGTFLMGDPDATTPRGSAKDTPGAPKVKGAGQVGNELLIDGLPLSTTAWMKRGDYFQIGVGLSSRLYYLLDDADTDGAGETTLLFWPNLRASSLPGDNQEVILTNPVSVFKLLTNSQGGKHTIRGIYQKGFTITAAESGL